MKKSIIALVLLFSLVLAFSSCGEGDLKAEDGGYDFAVGNSGASIESSVSPEEYGKFIENEFISTSNENISTFAADVDTASYAYFRKLVNAGYSLSELNATAGSAIRTEEMINYFDYGYSAPAENELFSTQMQIAKCPWNENAQLLILGLNAKEIEIAPKNNLVFLIDVSGSMDSSDKLGLLKTAFAHLTDKLGEDDVVSIVTYAGDSSVVLKGCSGSKKETIINAVNSLKSGGSTNGQSGLKKAYEIAEENFISGGNNRIIMASDGDLNVGISSEEELEKFVSEKRESGVFLSVLGFGTGNYKDSKMETIADCGNGVYYYIDSETEAEKVFGNEIFSTLYTIAKDVKLQITFNKESVEKYRLVGYENRLLNKEDFQNDTKDAGDLGAGHSLTVCYEIVLTDNAKTAEDAWLTLAVRYKNPDADKSEENNYSFGKEVYTETPSDNFKFVCAVIETSMIIRKSEYIGSITLENVKKSLEDINLTDSYKAQFYELITKLINNK